MAKKKINIKSVTADVPSGDVNISYKNVRIAGLSESTTAVLETEDTICEDDIEVEYTKPEPADVTIPIYYRTSLATVLIDDVPELPGTKKSFELNQLSAFGTISASETGWTDDTMTDYTTDSGINAEFSSPLLTVDFYQPKEIPAGKTRYVITLER